jgi:tRNA (guanine-N7-)-methyltransferase
MGRWWGVEDGAQMVGQAMNGLGRTTMVAEWVPADYFERQARAAVSPAGRPLEIDLGCGDGSFLLALAAALPEHEFLGVERLLGRVRKVCKKIGRRGLANARVLRLDSKYVVEWLLPEASVTRLHLLCPDPWPKFKHQRRRIVQVEFLAAVKRALVVGGEFLFMTDHEDYFRWAEQRFEEFGGLERLEWDEQTFFYPKTDFQVQWEAEGKRMWRIRGKKLGVSSDE